MRTIVRDPYTTGGTTTLAGLWIIAPDFWAWVGTVFTERGVITLSALWLILQATNMIAGWIARWRNRDR